MKKIFLFLSLLIPLAVSAQFDPCPEKISDPVEYFSKTITPGDLRGHLSFLASEELEGRETGERGQHLAARYLAGQFQKIGLKPAVVINGDSSWYQPFQMAEVKLKGIKLMLSSGSGESELSLFKDFLITHKSDFIRNYNSELLLSAGGNLTEKDVAGKWVLLMEDASGGKTGAEKRIEELKTAGAEGVFFVRNKAGYQELEEDKFLNYQLAFRTMQMAGSNHLPVIHVQEKSMEALFTELGIDPEEVKKSASGKTKLKPLKLSIESKADAKVIETENVLGMIEGTDLKDEVLILTAHYDHLGIEGGQVHYGADDDGSGTSAILEMAEAFMTAVEYGYRPRRTILFMPVSAEEKGLFGSEFYTMNPVFPLENTIANLNIDMIGRIDPAHERAGVEKYVYIIGSDKLSTDLHEINETANTSYTDLELDYTYNAPDDPNRFYYRSDHYNFAKNNIPVIFYFTGVHVDYHKPTDTIDKIMFPKMTEITRLIFATAWELANRDQRPAVDKKNDFPEKY